MVKLDPRAFENITRALAEDPSLGAMLPGGSPEVFFASVELVDDGDGDDGPGPGTNGMGDTGEKNGETLIPQTTFVNFPTAPPPPAVPVPVPVPQPVEAPEDVVVMDDRTIVLAPGDDLRDAPVQGGAIGALAVAGPLVQIAIRILRGMMGGATRITATHWNRLPSWAKTALIAVGIGIGTDLALDVPGIPGDSAILGLGGGDDGQHLPTHVIDGHLGAHIIGGWVANGIQFYRLSDGKLAVQNKLGRWKVWKPKKPIVLYASGATDLKTLLRADAVLNRQAKKIAAMLNRRAPRTRRAPAAPPISSIVVAHPS